MSSVTTAIVADIKRQFGAGVDQLRAKHEAELKADVAALRADLLSQLGRMESLSAKVAKVAKPVSAVVAKAAPVANGPVAAKSAPAKRTRAKRAAKGVVRFRDPENPAHTWSGRGTNPAWFKAGIAAGKSKDYFAVTA